MPFLPWILAILGALFAGKDLFGNAGGVSVYREVPAGAAVAGAIVASKPTAAQVTRDLVNTPSSVWGLAALGFVGVFVIAQLRAAGHEAASSVKDTYDEANRVTRAAHESLKNPDTTNGSRRLKDN